MRRKKLLAAVIVLLLAVAVISGVYAFKYADDLAEQKAKYDTSQTELLKRKTELQHVNTELEKAKVQYKENDAASQKRIQEMEQEKKDLEQQLQAKLEQKSKLAAAAQAVAQTVSNAVQQPVAYAASGCGDDTYANYIYMHESGCNLTATNAEGCVGIGQACPASKLQAVCPGMDYACQNQFFTSYAVTRYGSWEAAYNTWLTQHWW